MAKKSGLAEIWVYVKLVRKEWSYIPLFFHMHKRITPCLVLCTFVEWSGEREVAWHIYSTKHERYGPGHTGLFGGAYGPGRWRWMHADTGGKGRAKRGTYVFFFPKTPKSEQVGFNTAIPGNFHRSSSYCAHPRSYGNTLFIKGLISYVFCYFIWS
jgi:hypothetical protein